ncbi:hypothetical protein [Methanoregula sp.]|uniref:Kelch repeat-containing protein n=1 Tax=Methanoregula sp. TaxID=2052170 RepID=UPI003565E777
MKIFVLSILVLFFTLTGIAYAETPAYGNWTEITNNADFGPKGYFGSCSFDNQLWVIGGSDDRGNFTNDVWSSFDGKNWNLITSNASFSPRVSFGVAEFNNRLWVIGGASKESGMNDIWSSRDGKNWDLVTTNANFTPRSDMGVTVFDNRLWVIGGYDSKAINDVWSSRDGKDWILVTSNANFSPRYSPGVAVFDNRLWVIGGAETNEVWSSQNGKNWILVNGSAPFKKMEFTPVAVLDNKLWIVGGGSYSPTHQTSHPRETAYDEIWSSPDGNNWTLETEHAGFGPRFLHGVIVFKNGIWVIGGMGTNFKDVWYMPSLRPQQTPEASSPLITSTRPGLPQTTAKAGSSPLPICVSLCIAAGVYLDLARRN